MFRSLRRINPILTPGRQHDSHEFIVGLIDKVETGLKRRKMIEEFQKRFIGELCSEVKCSSCKYVSKTKENFTTLSLVSFSTLFTNSNDFLGDIEIQEYFTVFGNFLQEGDTQWRKQVLL
jgi:ubiquitin C-terminal hydrolase